MRKGPHSWASNVHMCLQGAIILVTVPLTRDYPERTESLQVTNFQSPLILLGGQESLEQERKQEEQTERRGASSPTHSQHLIRELDKSVELDKSGSKCMFLLASRLPLVRKFSMMILGHSVPSAELPDVSHYLN